MIVRAFLDWMDRAGPAERVEAVEIFAQSFLSGALGGEEPGAVEAALTLVLDDPAVSVRRALAQAFADRADVPRHIAVTLAGDQPQVGALLIARSPLLTEADLVELALTAHGTALIAIAFRHEIDERVATALISRGEARVGLVLARNPGAQIAEADLATLVEQSGADAELREALLARPALPASIRHRLMLATRSRPADVDGAGVPAGHRQTRLIEDDIQEATLEIARRHPGEIGRFVAYLRENGHLTPALLLRSLLGGDTSFVVAGLADLTGLRPARIAGLIRSRSAVPIAALLSRAGIPGFLETPLAEAIRAAVAEGGGGALSLAVIRAAQAACLDVPGEEGIRLMALLRRYEADAARIEARRIGDQLRALAAPALIEHGAEPLVLEACPTSEANENEDVLDLTPADIVSRDAQGPGEFEAAGAGTMLQDEPVPDLRSLIAQWRAEAALRENASETAGTAREPGNDDAANWSLRLAS